MSTAETHRMGTGSKIVYGALAILWVVVGGVTGLFSLTTPFLFDAPGAIENPATIALALAILSCPMACLTAIVMIGRAIIGQKVPYLGVWAFLPFASIVLGTAAVSWIIVVQDGKFTG